LYSRTLTGLSERQRTGPTDLASAGLSTCFHFFENPRVDQGALATQREYGVM